MEYENTHQARFNKDYLPIIGKDATGVWRIEINSPGLYSLGTSSNAQRNEPQSVGGRRRRWNWWTLVRRHCCGLAIVDVASDRTLAQSHSGDVSFFQWYPALYCLQTRSLGTGYARLCGFLLNFHSGFGL